MRAIPATLIPTTDHIATLSPTSIRKKLGSFASASESQAIKNAPFFHNLLSDTCSVKYASRLVLMTKYARVLGRKKGRAGPLRSQTT